MGATTKPGAKASNGTTAHREGRPVTVPDFLAAKASGRRLTMLTAYDSTMARLLDSAGVDSLLVGDSLGMVIQGQPDSLAVTLDEMVYHTRLVVRVAGRVLVTHDMLGLCHEFQPRFVKQYAHLGHDLVRAVEDYCREVRDGTFPSAEHEFR